jgi:caa(3)-type oxidase subunit IV
MNETQHPTKRTYIIIAVVLAIATIIELGVVNMTDETARTSILLALTLVKAALVALFYMHLKFDSRLYTAMFVVGIFVFTIPFAIVMLILMQPR